MVLKLPAPHILPLDGCLVSANKNILRYELGVRAFNE